MRKKGKNKIQLLLIAFIFVILSTGCKREPKHSGFILQRFNVVNNQLNSIINGIKDSTHILKRGDDVIVLDLRTYNSNPIFCFSSTKKDDLNEYYIYSSNARIVGYIENKNIPNDIIVLSDINYIVDFDMTFYKFIVPTLDKKQINYIYFPDNQYIIDRRGFGTPPKIFDPFKYIYIYKGNKIFPFNNSN